MTSQNSISKISFFRLLRDDLRHKPWMIALSILGSFLSGPLALLFTITNFRANMAYMDPHVPLSQYKAGGCVSFLEQNSLLLQLSVALFGALIVGLFGFRYLYSKRMVDLYHSAPVSRRKLFLVSWLSGFLIWFLPFLISNLVVGIAIAVYVGNVSCLGAPLGLLLRNALFLSLCFLIVYHTCLVSVMLSGNVINAIVNTLIYGLGVFCIYFCIFGCMTYFLDNFDVPASRLSGNISFILSPLATPILLTVRLLDGAQFAYWGRFLAGGTAVMLLNWVLAYRFYLKRPSELSERGTDHRLFQPAFRLAVAFLSGLAFSLFFCEMANSGKVVWALFGAWFGCSLAFCLLNIIYHTSFKEILSHKKQYGAVLISTVAFLLVMYYDVFGYDTYLPGEDSITALSVYCPTLSGYDNLEPDENGYIREKLFDSEPAPELRFTDRKAIHRLLAAATGEKADYGYSIPIFVKVSTTLGSYYRQYRLSYTDLQYLAPFVESEEYLRVHHPAKALTLGMPRSIVLYPVNGMRPTLDDPEQIRQLMEAYHQDFMDHHTIEDLMRSDEMSSLLCYYVAADDSIRAADLSIFPWYENTLAFLEAQYPRQVWDLHKMSITSLTIDVEGNPLSEDQGPLETLYDYFGYAPDGTPREALLYDMDRNEEKLKLQSSVSGYFSWNVELDSPELLEKLRPWMILGDYHNPLREDYIYLGRAMLENDMSVRCYVEYGKMPPELMEYLSLVAVYNSYTRNSPDTQYYNGGWYEEELPCPNSAF